MSAIEPPAPVWVKSSLSFANGNCAEVAALPGGAVDVRNSRKPARETFPCCQHCIDGDGMLPCGEVHDEPCGTGDCGLVTDAELARWRKGLQL